MGGMVNPKTGKVMTTKEFMTWAKKNDPATYRRMKGTGKKSGQRRKK